MFWLLPQAIRGTLSVQRVLVGVLCIGSVLVGLLLSVLLIVFALPVRSEVLVLLAWSVQTAYVLLASLGVWRSARNGRTPGSRGAARILAVAAATAQVWLFVHLFGAYLSRIVANGLG